MRHDQKGTIGATQLIHRLRDGLQRVDVEPGVRLIEDRQARLEDGELQDFIALLFAAREPLVHRAVHHRIVPADRLELLFEKLEEVDRIELRLSPLAAKRVQRRPQEIGIRDAANLDRILEREEDTCPRTLLRFHVE